MCFIWRLWNIRSWAIPVSYWLKGTHSQKQHLPGLWYTYIIAYVSCKWTLYTMHDMRHMQSSRTQTNNHHQRAKRMLVKAVFFLFFARWPRFASNGHCVLVFVETIPMYYLFTLDLNCCFFLLYYFYCVHINIIQRKVVHVKNAC